ncbi:hypothetical protein [Kiloniella majae]|uniref:hypothetical protein n=1 Tax=Kiloniella majae TaxID=1938558 RepID=UPI000A279095|nr:hypothetical protein [Kiloniella majae]
MYYHHTLKASSFAKNGLSKGTFLSTLILVGALGFSGTAQAGGSLFQKLKNNLENEATEEVTKEATKLLGTAKKEVIAETTKKSAAQPTTSPSTEVAAAGQTPELGTPSSDLVSMTKCTGLKPENITIGSLGDYTFQQGFSNEKRAGLINRRAGSLSDDCILPSLNSREIAYMEVDEKTFDALGSSNDWEMQCIKSGNPGAGVVGASEPKTEYPYTVNVLSGKDMMLHCGNSENVAECAEGSNSSRSSAWKKNLNARGKTMLSVMANTSTLAPAQGEKLYCQYYNKKSGNSLFAFEYLRLQN